MTHGVKKDYTIFLKQRYFVGDRVAQVVLGTSVTQQFEFILKSGQFPDMESITTVSRSLNDFLFLRNQLAVEYPEAALYELDLFMTCLCY